MLLGKGEFSLSFVQISSTMQQVISYLRAYADEFFEFFSALSKDALSTAEVCE
jgi:hypothetical protein